jgi:hypothetical protein
MPQPGLRPALFENQGVGSGMVASFPGDIRLMGFRPDEMKDFWYAMNGDRFSLDSPQGKVLDDFSDNFKEDWNITAISGLINVPDMIGPNGELPFFRVVNGVDRLPGSWQGDAIRNIATTQVASILGGTRLKANNITPFTFVLTQDNREIALASPIYSDRQTGNFGFDASTKVPTADENRPVNIGLVPAIYLGV